MDVSSVDGRPRNGRVKLLFLVSHSAHRRRPASLFVAHELSEETSSAPLARPSVELISL